MNDDAKTLFRHPKASVEEVAKTHEVRRVEVAHDPGVSFSLPVLRGMSTAMPREGMPLGRMRPEPLALFARPPDLEGPRLHVSVQRLEWEVDPLEWLRWTMVKDGWRVALLQTHPGPNGPRYEVGALREVEGVAVVRRTMAVRSGARMVRCDASARLREWESWHDALWHSLDGFRLGRVTRGPIEALVAHEHALVSFALPGSWEARSAELDDDGTRWVARMARDAQRGAMLRVEARPADAAPDAQRRRAAVVAELRGVGATLTGLREVERAEFSSLIPGWVGQWQAGVETANKGRGVLVLAQREEQGVVVDYMLVLPAAGTEHLDWMRGTRALDVAVATSGLRPAMRADGAAAS